MALLQRLKDDLKQAMKEGDKGQVSVLRLILADINNAEIARGIPLEDNDVLGVISKQATALR